MAARRHVTVTRVRHSDGTTITAKSVTTTTPACTVRASASSATTQAVVQAAGAAVSAAAGAAVTVAERLQGAVVGSLVADAAVQPCHWVYNAAELRAKLQLHGALAEPEFLQVRHCLSLPFHCLTTVFHCPFTALRHYIFHCLFTALRHCLSLPFHCRKALSFTAFSLP